MAVMAFSNNHDPTVIPFIINNESVEGAIKFDVTSPKSGQVLYQCSGASADDANRAVAAAHAAFLSWSKLKPSARRDLLWKAADIMLARKDELIRYQQEETGATAEFPELTLMLGLGMLRDAAGRLSSIEGTVPTVAREGQSAIVIKEPYGVILGIAPW
jgi:acyl-CoA reductase-like NAD-dependent aldehyde dehydrogenase